MKNFISLIFLSFSFIIYAQNNTPVANDLSFEVNEGSTHFGNLIATDDDGDNLTFNVVGSPSNGTLTLNTDGSFTYEHGGGEGTSDTFTFNVTDSSESQATSSTATVTITIVPVNDPPVVSNVTKTLDEGSSEEIIITGTDAEGSILVYEIVQAPVNGTFTLDSATGSGYYTHNGSETTSDSVIVRAVESNGGINSNDATITITVTAVNDSPVSPDFEIYVDEGLATQTLSFQATDAEGDNLTINVSSQGNNGTAVVNGLDFVYTHDGSETSSDTFTYSVSDGSASSSGTITVVVNSVNDAPSGVADTYYINRNSDLSMNSDIGVLRNDTDPDSDSSTFTVSLGNTVPAYGNITLNTDGSFDYSSSSSNSTYTTDSFTYFVSDDSGAQSAEVTVTLEVAEIIPTPNSYNNNEGETLSIDQANGVISNDLEQNGLAMTATVVTEPTHGTLTLLSDGSFEYVHDGSENRKDVFTYKLANVNGDESKSTFVVINNANVNDAPTSNGTSISVNEEANIQFTPSYSDSDSDLNSGISFTITSDVENGFLVNNEDGTFTYSHNGDENTSDSFTYTVTDGEYSLEGLAGSITINPVNDKPSADDQDLNLDESSSVVVNFSGSDVDGDELSFVILTNPSNGSLITSDEGVTTYTHNGTETTSDSFTYASYDGTVQSDAGTVSFTVNPVNSAPVLTAISITIDENASTSFNLNNFASDPEGQSLTFTITDPTNGTVSIDGPDVTYSHDGSETVSDSFTFTATDEGEGSSSSTGTIAITLNPVNDSPVITATTFDVDQYDNVTFDIPVDDAEGNDLTYTIETNPSQGTIQDNGNGNFTYFNNTESDIENSTESDSFSVTVNDGSESVTGTMTFNINGIDQNQPQIILTSSSSSLTETASGGSSLTVTASLVSNSFYSENRDMPTDPVEIGEINSLDYKYIGEWNGNKYYFYKPADGSHDWKSHADAKNEAERHGGYLWTIESAAENDAVYDLLDALGMTWGDVFIGLNFNYDLGEVGQWEWVNGHDYDSYTNWDVYTTNTDDAGFITNPIVKWHPRGWQNYSSNEDGRFIIEFDNNITIDSDVVINVSTSDSDATLDSDFSITGGGTITIPANQKVGTLTIAELADTDTENTETIVLKADSVVDSNARIKTSQNSVAISLIDNEDANIESITPSTGSEYGEKDGSIVITANLDVIKPFDTSLTLSFTGDATINEDYFTNDDGYLETLSTGYNHPKGVVQVSSGDYYVAEERKIYKVESDGTKTLYTGDTWGNHSTSAQPITQAQFRHIGKMVIDKESSRSYHATDGDDETSPGDVIYLYDERVIRKIDIARNRIYYIAGSQEWNESFVNGSFLEARFRHIQDITLSNDGNTLYVIDDNAIRAIDLENEEVTTLTGSRDWGYNDGSLSSARFEGPRGIAMDSNGDLIVRQYGKLRKIDIDGDNVTTILENDWSSGDLVIDSADNVYFAGHDRHQLFSFSNTGELSIIINSDNNSGTLDGVLKNAKIERPEDIILNSSGDLVFVERNNTGSLRKIDFLNKLRIPAGQQSGTFTLNINDDGTFEPQEDISVAITSAEGIEIIPNQEVLNLTINSDDSAPEVQLVSADSNISEGAQTTLTFQLGNASESGARLDMSQGQKGNYVYLGSIGTHKYYMSYENKTWTDAKNIATNLGGYLVAIDDETENQWIRDQMSNNGYDWESVWIGFTDEANEGIFEWVNGSQSTYTNWNNGEPNNAGGEDYTELLNNGKWNDLPDHDRKFIIEFSGTVSSLPTVITYTAEESNPGEFVDVSSGTITIPAGSARATLTLTAKDDQLDEAADTVTYTITEIADANGSIGDKNSVVVTIDDDDLPQINIDEISDPSFNENGGELVITASILNAKPFESSLSVSLNQGDSDSAEYNTDYVIAELQNVLTFAGSGTSNYNEGSGDLASFNRPSGIVADSSGNLYVADSENNVIRKIDSQGVVTTYAGNGNWEHDRVEGFRTDVGFAHPRVLVFNANGELLVFEGGRHRISKIDNSGNVTRVIGDYNGSGWGDNDGNNTEAQFRDIRGMVFDSSGNLFVTDDGKIKKISFDAGDGSASSITFAGTGNWGYVDGAGSDAEFREPFGITIDSSDNLYVADRHNHRIRKITPSGDVSTYAGANNDGYQDGSLLSSRFRSPSGISTDSNGDMYITEIDGYRIRKIDTSESNVSTVAGSGMYGHLDSDLLSSKFKRPIGITSTSSAIYISDTDAHRIRKIELLPSIKIPAGATSGTLTLRGKDDFKYESLENLTVSVTGVSNALDVSYDPITASIVSDDDAPIAKISIGDNILNEANNGTVEITVSLSDVFSSGKIDMDESDKSDYYYLGNYDGSNYYASKNNRHYNFDEAKSLAESLGGQLAIITSSGEQETIVQGIYNSDPEFSQDNNRWLNHWIGLDYDDNSNWVWSNGITSSYENWRDTWQRDEHHGREAAWLHEDGKWYSARKHDHRRFIVEFSSAISDSETLLNISFADLDGSGTTVEGAEGTADFSSNLNSGQITIPAGNANSTVILTAVDNDGDEPIERFTVNLDGAVGESATINSEETNSVNVTINDSSPTNVTLSIQDNVSEISEVDGQAILVAELTNTKLYPVSVELTFADSGDLVALFGSDYESSDLNAVTTFVGSGNDGYLDGNAESAMFSNRFENIIEDNSGNILVADLDNMAIRKIDGKGNVSTFYRGNDWNNELRGPTAMAIHPTTGDLYVAEVFEHRISIIDQNGNLTRLIDSSSENGDYLRFDNQPRGLVFDSNGTLFVQEDHRISKVEFNGDAVSKSTFVGNGNWGDRDGFGDQAEFGIVRNIVIDSNNNIYYADEAHHKIKKVSPDGNVITIAGEWWDYADGYGTNARFRHPERLAIDSNDNLYVSDRENYRIRKIEKEGDRYKVSTIAGNGNYGFVDGSPDQSEFKQVTALTVSNGILYAWDRDERKLRKLLLNPVMNIAAGSKTATFNISGIDDTSYESDESIIVTGSSSDASLASSEPLNLTLTSDEDTPKVVLKSNSSILNENEGTISFDVVLVDSKGAAANWANTDLPSESSNAFDFMGEYDGHKYYFSRDRMTWEEARQNALRQGGRMLVIEDRGENDFIGSIMIHDGTWIGHYRPTDQDVWSNIYGDVNYTNWAQINGGEGTANDITGYALTYGNEWFNHDQYDTRHYILEYGPVASSELDSSVRLKFAGNSTFGAESDNDYSSSLIEAVIPANSQKTTITLSGLDDGFEEEIETIEVSLELITDDEGNSVSNVELGEESNFLSFLILDDEVPNVTYSSSETEISENGGSVTITAELSNAKLYPTTVYLSLDGTSTANADYTVSALYGYENFLGSSGERGLSNESGSNARLNSPTWITPYFDDSFLFYDEDAHVIRKSDSNGNVSLFLGIPYSNCGGCEGDAGQTPIDLDREYGGIAVDLSWGGVYWVSQEGHIMAYNPDNNLITNIRPGDSSNGASIGGIAILNSVIYYSKVYEQTINALYWNGGGFDDVVIVGHGGNTMYDESQDGVRRSFDDPVQSFPSYLEADPVNNRIYANTYAPWWMDYEYNGLKKGLIVLDIDSRQQWSYRGLLPENPYIGQISFDPSSQNLFYTNQTDLHIIGFDDSGNYFNKGVINGFYDFDWSFNSAVVGNNLFVVNHNQHTIGKIGLSASILIPAGETIKQVTFDALKDPWFEDDETMDVNVASISNGFSDSSDIADVTIVESTRLTLVEDAPFEGVENGKVSWGDYDRDGDMDLALMGDASIGTITNVYKNNGEDGFTNTLQNFTKVIGGDIEFVDVDQDGWLDVAVSGNSSDGRISKLYINVKGQYFEESVSYSEQVIGLSQADMEWADVDNDSDPDLIISGIDNENNFRTIYYTNIGNGNFFEEKLFYSNGYIQGEIDIVDNNNDGDNDLFITGISGSVGDQFYNNTRIDNTYYWGGNHSDVDVGLSGGNTEYLDIDGDGLMDFLSIGKQDINSSVVDSRSNLMDLNYLPKLSNIDFDFADYNNDGLSDVVISGEDSQTGLGITKLYVTSSDLYGDQYQLIETDLELEGLRESSVDWIDYDKDGDLDLFITGLDVDGEAKSLLYKAENKNNLNTPPSKIEGLNVFGYGGNGTLVITWDKPQDDYSKSFRYNVRVGTTPGGSDILYANSITDEGENNGSTLLDISSLTTRTNTFLTVLPGTYYVSVQAIDGGNLGGPFSDEVSTTVDYPWNLQRLGGLIDRRLRTEEHSSMKFIDIDKDGDKDLIGGNVGTRDFGRSAINVFAFQNDIFEPKRQYWGGVSSFEIADFNRDGNEDIIVGVEENNGTRVYILLNTYDQDEERENGDREYFTEHWPFEGDNLLESVYNIKFAVKDLNNDGLSDVLMAGESSKISSEATAVVGVSSVVPFDSSGAVGFNGFYLSSPESIGDDKLSSLSFISFDFGDIDNDLDYDFLISGYSFDGYKTLLYENKRLLDDNGAVVQPMEVYFEENESINFVSVKEGTTQFVDFDADGKLDIIFSGQSADGDIFTAYKNTGNNKFAAVDLNLPPVRDGNFTFGDMFGRGVNDVVYSGTVSGQGTFSKIAYFDPDALRFIDSGYELFLDDANIGMADFDGDYDTDLVLTGKWNGDPTDYFYHGYVYMNVRGFAGEDSSANSSDDNNTKTSSRGDVRESTSDDNEGAKTGNSLNTRPNPPSSISVQRQRLAENSYEVVINWTAGSDDETPVDALTYSLKIGTSAGGEEILVSGANSEGVRNSGTPGNASTNRSWKLTLPEGVYYASVQSVDASFIGSKFSSPQDFTVTSAYKLGDSNGDDSVNILDLTSNLDYILGNDLKVFVNEVADVNGDGNINVTDISGIVNIILTEPGIARGSSYDPYEWEYYSNKPIGEAKLVRRDGKIYLENDKPVTSLQFSFDSTVEYELSEEMENMTVVNFVEDGIRTFVIYSYNNQRIDELTDIIFDYIDLNDSDEFELRDMSAGSENGLSLDIKFSDESFFDDSDDIIQIYPNPVVSDVNLLTDITENVNKIEVSVYNVLGVSVYQTNINSIGRLNSLDLSMLSSGVYTVKVRMITDKNEEVINVHKLIKK